MGQGVRTDLPMIVAEELSCDWNKMKVVQADLHAKYGEQLTGGSLSTRTSYTNLRKAGAAAREMLISAAAGEWQVERTEYRAENSAVLHPATKRSLTYSQLTERASAILPPADPPLKNSADFTLIGSITHAFTGDPAIVAVGAADVAYLCDAANRYFRARVEPSDVIRSVSGVNLVPLRRGHPGARDGAMLFDRRRGRSVQACRGGRSGYRYRHCGARQAWRDS